MSKPWRFELTADARADGSPFRPEIPRVVTIHDISEEEKQCACGQEMVRIGEEICEKLEVIPARIGYADTCGPSTPATPAKARGTRVRAAVRIAAAPEQLLPKSIASPALVAYIVVGKFCDSLPFYRQEKQFARIGVDISRQDMANWSIAVFQRLRPLRELLRGEIRQGPLVQIDETTVQVMGEPGRPEHFQELHVGIPGWKPGAAGGGVSVPSHTRGEDPRGGAAGLQGLHPDRWLRGLPGAGKPARDRARRLLGAREEEVLRGQGGFQEQRQRRCGAIGHRLSFRDRTDAQRSGPYPGAVHPASP